MFKSRNPEDFEILNYDDLEIYIEKDLLFNGSEFLLVHERKYRISLDKDKIKVDKL